MANLLFISINDINASGLRILSSCLKAKGHKVSIIFLKLPGYPYSRLITDNKRYLKESRKLKSYDWVSLEKGFEYYRNIRGPGITSKERKILISQIEKIGPDIIGFSLTAPLIRRSAKISKYIKSKMSIPVIWGGPGATVDPGECAEHCDFVCVGEAEKTIEEIAEKIDQNESIREVNNLCYKTEGRLVRNPLNQLMRDLDNLPFMDIDPSDKYLIENDSLIEEYAQISFSGRYHIVGSRGCPYNCAYCTESYYKRLYAQERFLRRRSPQNIIDEIKEALKIIKFDFIEFDDEVFSLDYQWLKEFSAMYKKEIDLPFFAYIYPKGNIDKQVSLLKQTGLDYTCLAIQSGSSFVNKNIFHRPFNRNEFIEMAHKLESWGIPYYTDVLVHNPFENEDDLKDALDLLLQINPFHIYQAKLHILKNSTLSEIIQKEHKRYKMYQVSNRINRYYNRLFWLTSTDKSLVRFCLKLRIFRVFPFLLNSDRLLSIIKFFIRTEPLTTNQLKKWKQILENKQKWFNKRGVKYALAVTPNNHKYYPENILGYLHKIKRHNRFDQLNEYLTNNSNFEFIDLRNQMKNKGEDNYSSMDITDPGALSLLKKLSDNLLDWFPRENILRSNPSDNCTHDNANITGVILNRSLFDRSISSLLKKHFNFNFSRKKNRFDDLKMKWAGGQNKPAIVVEEIPERIFDIVPARFGEKLVESLFNDSSNSLLLINQSNYKHYIKDLSDVSITSDSNGIIIKSKGIDPYFSIVTSNIRYNGSLLIKIIMTSPRKTDMQIYYRTEEKPFIKEQQSEITSLKKGLNICYVQLSSKNIISPLRFDPANNSGVFVLHSFEIRN